MSSFIQRREKRICDFTEKARYFKVAELPVSPWKLSTEDKALVWHDGKVSVYVFHNALWRKKLELEYSPDASVSFQGKSLCIVSGMRTDLFSIAEDPEEGEVYFRRRVLFHNVTDAPVEFDGLERLFYFPDGALSDYTYVSYKWMGRKQNLGAYPYPTDENDYLATRANNQLFYNCCGELYCGSAYLGISHDWQSDLNRDDAWLTHSFFLRTPLKTAPGETAVLEFCWFAGKGKENHIGHLSNVLWRLNRAGIHSPQTDIREFLKNYTSVWPRAELTGNVPGDHYAAHYFSNFFGQFPDGYRPDDQFGCSWLSYDLLKANWFYKQYKRTGDEAFREKVRILLDFYLYNHHAGNSRLTYPFHTGKFMRDILPFCEKSGWGAPFEPEKLDSLALPEMIYDALTIFEKDKSLFQNDYPAYILEEVLSLQQPDGHFRRLYGPDLKPVEKIGWISQYSETQTWIPVLLKLSSLTGDVRPFEAALRTAERCWLDLQEQGMFAMGGCETDYPCLWDVDGYRTMLWAFLDLFEFTNDPLWRDRAEQVQLFGNTMMMGYNVPPLPGSFYDRIHWKTCGMVATSFYPHPDYMRTQCTATGNQSVSWIGYLLLRLYRATGKKIYAERGIAAFRQVMVYRDEESLKGNPHRDNILYTIYENNPQMDDESGLYKNSIPENSYSLFLDLYLYLDDILEEFGGIYVDPELRHTFGIDCAEVVSCNFEKEEITFRNSLKKERLLILKVKDRKPVQIPLLPEETKTVHF